MMELHQTSNQVTLGSFVALTAGLALHRYLPRHALPLSAAAGLATFATAHWLNSPIAQDQTIEGAGLRQRETQSTQMVAIEEGVAVPEQFYRDFVERPEDVQNVRINGQTFASACELATALSEEGLRMVHQGGFSEGWEACAQFGVPVDAGLPRRYEVETRGEATEYRFHKCFKIHETGQFVDTVAIYRSDSDDCRVIVFKPVTRWFPHHAPFSSPPSAGTA